MMNRLDSSKPPMIACQPLIGGLDSQIGAARARDRLIGMGATPTTNPMPRLNGSNVTFPGHGHRNGAFQPPKKSVTVSAERMNTFTYSAKKKNPKRIPEYSVAKPATISESASVRSKGVRLPSAVAAMKKIRKPSGWRK